VFEIHFDILLNVGDLLLEDPLTLSIWKDALKTLWLDLHHDDWTDSHFSKSEKCGYGKLHSRE
jgi:hypothetical protein